MGFLLLLASFLAFLFAAIGVHVFGLSALKEAYWGLALYVLAGLVGGSFADLRALAHRRRKAE